jgi:hypothetical protein
MTVSSSIRIAGPYTSNGINLSYTFAFDVFQQSDVQVVRTDLSGVETILTLTTDYIVVLNADQTGNPGGTVLLTVAATSGFLITLTSQVPYTQLIDIQNNSGFFPSVITTGFDKLTILIQQLALRVNNAIQVPISSSQTATQFLASLFAIQTNSAASATSAAASATSAATSFTNFSKEYLGSFTVDPTLDNQGAALISGALYYNSSTLKLRIYTGATWTDTGTAVAASYNSQIFSGTGAQTAFTLSNTPANTASCIVAVSGVLKQPGTDYNVSGNTLTFTVAPANAANNITTLVAGALAAGVPNSGSVNTLQLNNGVFNGLSAVSIASTDYVAIAQTSSSGNPKKALVSDIIALGTTFPSGTRMTFNQTSAPTGWTKDTTAALNDSIMRIVTGTVGSGGSTAFSTFNAQTATAAYILQITDIPGHAHSITNGAGSLVASSSPTVNLSSNIGGNWNAALTAVAPATATNANGGGGGHSHGMTTSIKYNDFIIASKN